MKHGKEKLEEHFLRKRIEKNKVHGEQIETRGVSQGDQPPSCDDGLFPERCLVQNLRLRYHRVAYIVRVWEAPNRSHVGWCGDNDPEHVLRVEFCITEEKSGLLSFDTSGFYVLASLAHVCVAVRICLT